MDVAGYNVGTDRSSGFMGNDESPVEYRGERISSTEDVLPCKTLLLSCGSRNNI